MSIPTFIPSLPSTFTTQKRQHACNTETITTAQLQSAHGRNANRLATWLAAEWSNKQQAMDNPPMWSHIHVAFRPLPWDLLNGYSLYTESAYDYDISSPYKTSVIHLVSTAGDDGDEEIELASYKIKDADEFWMGCYEPTLLNQLTKECLVKMSDHCNTVFKYSINKKMYIAKSRPGKCCLIKRRPDNGVGDPIDTYLDSNITLSPNNYCAWDLGRDLSTDKRIWGPAGGAFEFIPLQKFDTLVPEERKKTTSINEMKFKDNDII